MRRIKDRTLRLEKLELRQMLTVYTASAAADFAADFAGVFPQNNPNGDWAYFAADDTTTTLVPTDGNNPNTNGTGSGWVDPTPGIWTNYARGGPFATAVDTIIGHGPQKVVWTAPATVDMGAVQISGEISQPFEPTRQMQLRIYKNGNTDPFQLIQVADPGSLNPTALPPAVVAINPGDTLTIEVDGAGSRGNGVNTFAAWELDILEVDPEIDADFNGDATVDASDLPIWNSNYGTASGATQATGDADGDGDVDGSDFLIFQRQFGNTVLTDNEIAYPPYHPTAVIVQITGVTLPDGSSLDITGSVTDGLQEAFDYAADFGWGVFVLPGTYDLSAGLDVVERQGASFRLQDVTMNFDSSVTSYGLQFDSTMITDWYWDGGALNAANATDGVRIDPRNLHPLDGCSGFTPPASVDSRFIFDVPITAATNEVTMETTTRTINDNYFYFQGLTKNDLNILGAGFSATNTFFDAGTVRTDPAIPWDLFSTAGRVTVVTPTPTGPIGTLALVFLPDGSLLDTTGTTTSGLQEAFDHAAVNNLDLLVFGRGIQNSEMDSGLPGCGNTNQGVYQLNSTLTVGNDPGGVDPIVVTGRTYRIFNVTFGYSGSGTAMVINNMVNSDFELTGQVVNPTSTSSSKGLLIKPLDFTGAADFTGNKIRVEHVPGSNDTAGSIGVHIDATERTIENNEFYFTEILNHDTGIRVENPSATTFFRNNVLSTVHTHDWRSFGLRLGTTSGNSNNIHSNTIDIFTNTDGGPATTALQVWGDNNFFRYGSYGGGSTSGWRFESASADNDLYWFALSGAVVDLGTSNTQTFGPPPLFASATGALFAASSGSGSLSSQQSTIDLSGLQLSATGTAQVDSAGTEESDDIESGIVAEPLALPVGISSVESSALDVALAKFASDDADPLTEDELWEALATELS